MSIKDLLAAKQRRRLVVPVQISNPAADQEEWLGVYHAIEAAKSREDADPKELESLQVQLLECSDKLQAHFVKVELQALSADEWEAAAKVFEGDDDFDWKSGLPVLMAESCVDTELQDAEYWRETLQRPEWTDGERDALKSAILRLNVHADQGHVPKD